MRDKTREREREREREKGRALRYVLLGRRIDAFRRFPPTRVGRHQNPVCNSHCGPEQSAAGYTKLARFPFIYDPAPYGIFGKISQAK